MKIEDGKLIYSSGYSFLPFPSNFHTFFKFSLACLDYEVGYVLVFLLRADIAVLQDEFKRTDSTPAIHSIARFY